MPTMVSSSMLFVPEDFHFTWQPTFLKTMVEQSQVSRVNHKLNRTNNTRTHALTHARMHARTRTHAHTHTHTHTLAHSLTHSLTFPGAAVVLRGSHTQILLLRSS